MLKLFSAVGTYKQNVYSFVEFLCGLLLLPGYLETDHLRGKLKRKTMSPLQESHKCNPTTAMIDLLTSIFQSWVSITKAGWKIVP